MDRVGNMFPNMQVYIAFPRGEERYIQNAEKKEGNIIKDRAQKVGEPGTAPVRRNLTTQVVTVHRSFRRQDSGFPLLA
jgi:hypothetical protein